MSRKSKRRASRVGDSLIVVNIAPGPGVVDRFTTATAEARELAQAKRTVERALRAAGMPRRLAERTIAMMQTTEVMAEAARLAQTPTAPASTPTTPPRSWWRFWGTP